jgi:hypothetical protein
MAISQDLTIICGNDVVVPVQLYSGDSGSTVLDITGATLTYVVKKQGTEGYSALITKVIAAGGIAVVSAALGTITITFADTDTLPAMGDRLVGNYHHELMVTDSGGLKSTVFKGTLKIEATGIA